MKTIAFPTLPEDLLVVLSLNGAYTWNNNCTQWRQTVWTNSYVIVSRFRYFKTSLLYGYLHTLTLQGYCKVPFISHSNPPTLHPSSCKPKIISGYKNPPEKPTSSFPCFQFLLCCFRAQLLGNENPILINMCSSSSFRTVLFLLVINPLGYKPLSL